MDSKAYWIAFNMVMGIGPTRLQALLDVCGTAEAAWHAPIQQLQAAKLDRRTIENFLQARHSIDPQREWERTQAAGVQVLTWEDSAYPAALRNIDGSPPVLYLRGRLTSQDEWTIALVGTRRASTYGREVAQVLATELARQGVTIVSGLALGVDTVAHRAAIDAGGRTLAVLGSGVDQLYPPQNRGLALAIAEQGAIISDYALGTRPDAGNFPPRNRIISGLSRGCLIVEAALQSGSLITARQALEQGREVFAIPGSIHSPLSKGCHALIKQGAKLVESAEDILDELGYQSPRSIVNDVNESAGEESLLLRHLGHDISSINTLCNRSGLTAETVSAMLLTLELNGMVASLPGGCYQRLY